MSIDSRQFRDALGAFATGVTIVTTQDGAGKDAGMTVNSFSSVSLDPPMVLWSLAKNAHSHEAFLKAGFFGVHILSADQTDLSSRFATRGIDKFAGLRLERGHGNVPLLDGCAARFECKTVFRYEGGDHDILVGEVVSFEKFERESLLFVAGRYATARNKPAPIPQDPSAETTSRSTETSLQILLGRAMYQCQLGIRPELARNSLTELQHIILFCIGYYMPDSMAELIRLVGMTGRRVTQSDVDKLIARGLLTHMEAPSQGDSMRWRLTDDGQAILAKIAAMTKAIEDDALVDLDYLEIPAFKEMLRKIIQRTTPSWRKPL